MKAESLLLLLALLTTSCLQWKLVAGAVSLDKDVPRETTDQHLGWTAEFGSYYGSSDDELLRKRAVPTVNKRCNLICFMRFCRCSDDSY
uniref:Secreted protein n=1 Tax=Plectus sambesii TaxID=2011161 RepID=A0A914WP14_9BILA